MEGDAELVCKLSKNSLFQSTPSAWRETATSSGIHDFVDISIHSLRMEGDVFRLADLNMEIISIHSLRMEGDNARIAQLETDLAFQSTPSAWRETFTPALILSIASYFNPLPPHGGRQHPPQKYPWEWSFQSTPSAWRETLICGQSPQFFPFQSTPSAWRETYCTYQPV